MADTFPQVLAAQHFPGRGATAPGSVVLRDLGPTAPHRYATHFRNEEDPAKPYHVLGHYFTEDEKADAQADFRKRCERGY